MERQLGNLKTYFPGTLVSAPLSFSSATATVDCWGCAASSEVGSALLRSPTVASPLS